MTTPELYILETRFSFNGTENSIYPVILSNKGDYILVDCGYQGFLPLLEAAAIQAGTSLQRLTGILITHHDVDHIGGLFELKAAYPYVKIYAPDIEEEFIDGRQKSLRQLQAEVSFDALPDEYKPGALQFIEMHKQVKPVAVNQTFPVDDSFYLLDGVRIIHTAGHMPGHVSVFIEPSKTLIAADALVYENGELNIANPRFTLDMEAAIASVKKIRELQPGKIVCYHGGVVDAGIDAKLADLIGRYS